MKLWRHYLKGADAMVLIQCDHKNLEYSQTSNVLSLWLARWAESLSSHDCVIKPLEGKKIPADGPWNSHDYEIGYERPTTRLLAALQLSLLNRTMFQFKTSKRPRLSICWLRMWNTIFVGTQTVDVPDLQWIVQIEEELSN